MNQIELKVVLLGDTAVGKSSLLTSFIYEKFNDDLNSNEGASFLSKSVYRDNKEIIY